MMYETHNGKVVNKLNCIKESHLMQRAILDIYKTIHLIQPLGENFRHQYLSLLHQLLAEATKYLSTTPGISSTLGNILAYSQAGQNM